MGRCFSFSRCCNKVAWAGSLYIPKNDCSQFWRLQNQEQGAGMTWERTAAARRTFSPFLSWQKECSWASSVRALIPFLRVHPHDLFLMPSLGASTEIWGRHKHSEHSTCLSGMFGMRMSQWWEFGLIGFHFVLYQVFLVTAESPMAFLAGSMVAPWHGPAPLCGLTTFPDKVYCNRLLVLMLCDDKVCRRA